jgi:hypothetical protein
VEKNFEFQHITSDKVFIEFFFNFVTKFHCFVNFSHVFVLRFFLYIGNKTYVFCIWLLLIHCSYTEVDFYGVVYFLKPTFYEKLVDVVLTNRKNKCFNIQNFPTGISDCHNIISVTIKGDVPVQK